MDNRIPRPDPDLAREAEEDDVIVLSGTFYDQDENGLNIADDDFEEI